MTLTQAVQLTVGITQQLTRCFAPFKLGCQQLGSDLVNIVRITIQQDHYQQFDMLLSFVRQLVLHVEYPFTQQVIISTLAAVGARKTAE